jgi:hypothetical protein
MPTIAYEIELDSLLPDWGIGIGPMNMDVTWDFIFLTELTL